MNRSTLPTHNNNFNDFLQEAFEVPLLDTVMTDTHLAPEQLHNPAINESLQSEADIDQLFAQEVETARRFYKHH